MSDDIEGCWAAREDLVACAPLTRALDEIERLRAARDAARHEAQAATKLILEHQSKNCHLHAEISRLRAALREIVDCPQKRHRADGEVEVYSNAATMLKTAREALGEE